MRSKLPLSLTRRAAIAIGAVVIWSVATQRGSGPRPDAAPARPTDPPSRSAMAERYGKLPLAFEPNIGQTDAQVRFLARGSGYTLFLTDTAAVFALRPASVPRPHTAPAPDPARPSATIRLALKGTQAGGRLTAGDALPGVSNYLIGNDPDGWRTNVPQYAKARSHDVYRGIDVEYYGNQRQLEYDFVVAPGADAGQIAFDVDGADHLEIDRDGRLVMGLGAEQVRLDKPFAYQEVDGARQEIGSAYTLQETHTVRLQMAAYDHARTLVIDPVLVYAFNIGGTGDEAAIAIAIDASGNAYVAGATSSTDFPATVGVAQTTFGGGVGTFTGLPLDAFVAKLNAAGTALIYATYLGGAGDDVGFGIAIDGSGNAYVAGFTFGVNPTTNNFPTTLGAFQTTFGGGLVDGFVTKLNPSGQLAYSTYLGGACVDFASAIALDTAGNAYIAGQTSSDVTCTQNFPVTAGAFDTTFDAAGDDAIFAKLNAAGSALVYATYLGGVAGTKHNEEADGIAVDATGNAYLVGSTSSSDFPTTVGAYQTVFGGGDCGGFPCRDAFVAKINPGGNGAADLLYSTFLGNNGFDEGSAIAIDASGNAYVTGRASFNFPTTAGAYQRTTGGQFDVFITKLNPTASGLVFSTFFGGNGNEVGASIALDASQNVHVVGETNSFNLPTTADALSQTYNGSGASGFICEVPDAGAGPGCDGLILKLNPAGSVLIYASYLGGPGDDAATGVAVQGGNVFVSGATSSSFLARPAMLGPSLSGPSDAVVIKLALPDVGFTDDPVRIGANGTTAKAVHITELRSRVDAVRMAHGLGAYPYTDPTLTPASTIIKAAHITDLRTALNQAYTAAGLTPPEYPSDPGLTVGTIMRAAHINQLRRFLVGLEAGLGFAVYDATTYMTTACLQVGHVCDSGGLLNGRDTITNGNELHQPNTIANSCGDGTQGTFHVNASNDRLRVSTLDGTPFAPGKTVRIEAFVWVIGTANHLDLYYAANAASPSWTFVATVDAQVGGPQTMSATYVLPAGGFQAVRARLRSGGSVMPCTGNTSGFDDHDDLVFAVSP